jgi:branched-chain amino acid transport system ATP-binding protein
MALLEVRGLRVSYSFPVILGIDFDVEQGEIAVLFGLNGAGKTTTVATIAGLLRPDSGTITFDGESVTGLSTPELVRKGIALCPEGRRVFPELTIAQNLKLGAWTRRRSPSDVKQTEELVYEYFPVLSQRPGQLAGTMSGGEQQMLAVGRAMMSRPKLLMIDEASLGLSPLLATTVFRACRRIKESGTTVIIVEQNVGVLPYADRVLILEKGTMVYQGVGAEVRKVNLREQYLGGTSPKKRAGSRA